MEKYEAILAEIEQLREGAVAQVRAKLIPEKATMNRGGDVKEA